MFSFCACSIGHAFSAMEDNQLFWHKEWSLLSKTFELELHEDRAIIDPLLYIFL